MRASFQLTMGPSFHIYILYTNTQKISTSLHPSLSLSLILSISLSIYLKHKHTHTLPLSLSFCVSLFKFILDFFVTFFYPCTVWLFYEDAQESSRKGKYSISIIMPNAIYQFVKIAILPFFQKKCQIFNALALMWKYFWRKSIKKHLYRCIN